MHVPDEDVELPAVTPVRVDQKQSLSDREQHLMPVSATTPKMQKDQDKKQDEGDTEHIPVEMKRKSDSRSEALPKRDKKEQKER